MAQTRQAIGYFITSKDIDLDMRSRNIYTKTKNLMFNFNRMFGNYKDVVWLISDGRSGSTWISNLINHQKQYRELFEPIHPTLVSRANFLGMHTYVRAGDRNEALEALFEDIFSGRLTDSRVDFGNPMKLYRGLLVKDVFANLLAYWASDLWPDINTVLLLRNPFMVALSKQLKSEWEWFIDPLALLQQQQLKQDYLLEFEDLIYDTTAENNFVLNCILTWSIINYVPLQQFNGERLNVIFYENVKSDPKQELSAVIRDQGTHDVTFNQVFHKPSRIVINQPQPTTGLDNTIIWKNKLSSKEIDKGYAITDRFGLTGLYDDYGKPNRAGLNHFFSPPNRLQREG